MNEPNSPTALPSESTAKKPLLKLSSLFAASKSSETTLKHISRVEADPYDAQAWQSIWEEARSLPADAARQVFEAFLARFPTSGKYWKLYIDFEMQGKNFSTVEKLFQRCFAVPVLHLDLWKGYVQYMITLHEGKQNGREEIGHVYEYVIEHIGMDITSTPIWTDYLNFVKSGKTTSSQTDTQKMSAVRKLFQRALQNPMQNLEAIWRDYEAFENGLPNNKVLGRALLDEYQKKFASTRIAFRALKAHREGLLTNVLATPPRESVKDEHQVQLWRRLLSYEKTNPLRLETSDHLKRMLFTYNQSLLYLYHYVDMWYDAATYFGEREGFEEATLDLFRRGCAAMPSNLLMNFAYADFEESRRNVKGAKDVYEHLFNEQPSPLVFIQYLKFVRRTEDAKSARAVFIEARKRPECSYHVYVGSALQEFYVNKEPDVARRVFELGMKKYLTEPAYVLEYIDFLQHLNDENNLRTLFERVLSAMPPEKAVEIWKRFIAFENTVGSDLANVAKVEARRALAYPNQDFGGLNSLVQRYKYLELFPCNAEELDSIARSASFASSLLRENGSHKLSSTPGPSSTPPPADDALPSPRPQAAAASTRSRFPRPDVGQMQPFTRDLAKLSAPGAPNRRKPTDVASVSSPTSNTMSNQPAPYIHPRPNPHPQPHQQSAPNAPPAPPKPVYLSVPIVDPLLTFIAGLPPAHLCGGNLPDVESVLNSIRNFVLPPLPLPLLPPLCALPLAPQNPNSAPAPPSPSMNMNTNMNFIFQPSIPSRMEASHHQLQPSTSTSIAVQQDGPPPSAPVDSPAVGQTWGQQPTSSSNPPPPPPPASSPPQPPTLQNPPRGRGKRRGRDNGSDEEDQGNAPVAQNKPPSHDIYRSRQQQKLQKKG